MGLIDKCAVGTAKENNCESIGVFFNFRESLPADGRHFVEIALLPFEGDGKRLSGPAASDAHLPGGFNQRTPGTFKAVRQIDQRCENPAAPRPQSVKPFPESGAQNISFTLYDRANL